MQLRTHTYYGLYNGVNFIHLRHSEQRGWELGVDYNNDGNANHWKKLESPLLEQVEPSLKEYGFVLPRPIINEQEYEHALQRASELMDAEPNTRDSKELELWAIEIERYEEEHYPIDNPLDTQAE